MDHVLLETSKGGSTFLFSTSVTKLMKHIFVKDQLSWTGYCDMPVT